MRQKLTNMQRLEKSYLDHQMDEIRWKSEGRWCAECATYARSLANHNKQIHPTTGATK